VTHPHIHTPSKIIKPEDISLDDLQHISKEAFVLWTLTSGVKVDNNDMDFNSHRYLLPIYMDEGKQIVWQKAAQMGATIYQLLRVLWWLEQHQGRKGGLYFPTKEGVENLSKDRVTPLIQSCPSIAGMADEHDKLGLRKIGKSSLYLYHLGGVASKDSVPLDYITFDEVRLCSNQDIDQALERVSHSPYKYKVFMSTAGLPDSDINYRFNYGTQHIWMSKCGCPDGIDLARTFPDCVVSDDKRRNNKPYLRCPKCKWEIRDPQVGRYVAHNPGADHHSYHVSQLASKYITLADIWTHFERTTNLEEFYNAKLGLPYVDEANRGVSLEQCKSCVHEDLSWGKKLNDYCAMGVDQGAGYCMVVIADMNDNKKRIRHVEIIERNNPRYRDKDGKPTTPFERLRELMKEYNVKICVTDAMPNVNDALDFAQEFPGRVFLAYYAKEQKDAILWGDKIKYKPAIQKAGPLLKFKYTAILGRFPSLSISLGAWSSGDVACPPPDHLIQMCSKENTGQLAPEAVTHRLFSHLTRLIKRFRVINEETGDGKHEWIYSGGDPHLAHAWNYCNIALERLRRSVIFTFA